MKKLAKIFVFLTLSIGSCENEQGVYLDSNKINTPVVSVNKVFKATETFAIIENSIENDFNEDIVRQGICWNITGDPTIKDNNTESSNESSENFICEMYDLEIGTKYYIRPYAENKSGIGYGEEFVLNFDWGLIEVPDIDGNWYKTVKIGNQVWLKENLKVTHNNNGIEISNGNGIDYGNELMPEYYLDYNNSEETSKLYGKIYTWYAAKNACPTGWHMATEKDWNDLINYIGSENSGYLKSSGNLDEGTGLWKFPNTGGTDKYGLCILPSGVYDWYYKSFHEMSERALFAYGNDSARGLVFEYFTDKITYGQLGPKHALSVRCVKD